MDYTPFIQRTIELAKENVNNGGRPFSTIIIKDQNIVAEGVNLVVQTKDPTAHAGNAKFILKLYRNCCYQKALFCNRRKFSWVHVHYFSSSLPNVFGRYHSFHIVTSYVAMYYTSPDKVMFLMTRDQYCEYYRDDRKYLNFDTFYSEFGKPYTEVSVNND